MSDGTDRGIEFSLQYWTSCLSEDDSPFLVATVIQAIESLSQNPSQTIADIDLVSDVHSAQIKKWNHAIPDATIACVHELVENKVLAQPDAPAICTSELQLSYRDLDKYSTQLARHLAFIEVAPESVVCFCFDKSAWVIVTMYAILKAGGTCVAISPDYPDLRIQSILSSTKSRHVISEPKYAARFEGLVQHIITATPSFWDRLSDLKGVTPQRATPENTSFITFTSGSTGEPKGIVLEHMSMATSINYHGTFERMGNTCRSLQFGSYTFDVSVEEIFTTLSFGGCVCVPSEYERMNDLSGFIERLSVNWAHLTPTVAGMLHPNQLRLDTLVLGGEAIPLNIARKWASKTCLVASYGPAECSITCSGVVVPPEKVAGGLMGEPAGALLWIVDPKDHNRLAPIGCAGEILIEGPLLARGYLSQTQTEAAFIYDPSWASSFPVPGVERRRMYKSGDMARYNLDGSISSVGRKDIQVKVHGQRVDLREVEHHLNAQQAVRHSVAMIPANG